MILDELITDRTQADLEADLDKVYADYVCLNRVEEACRYLSEVLGISIETKVWTMNEFRTQSHMDRIRDNIRVLRDSFFAKENTPATPQSITYKSIYQANDIEQILKDIGEMYDSMVSAQNRLSFTLGRRSLGNRR